jgi:hypothetical protein
MEAKPTPTGSSATLSPLTPELHHGLTAVAFFASISLVSSSSLFIYFTYKLIRWRIRVSRRERRERQAEAASQAVDLSLGLAERHFVGDEEHHQPAEALPKRPRKSPNQFLILVYNLFLADTLQAVAFFINAVWVARDGIFVGTPACFLQGWLVSTGDLSSSCFIFAIAVHTYLSVVREYKPPQWALYLTVFGLWLFVYGMTVIGIGATSNGYLNGGYYVRASAWVSFNLAQWNGRPADMLPVLDQHQLRDLPTREPLFVHLHFSCVYQHHILTHLPPSPSSKPAAWSLHSLQGHLTLLSSKRHHACGVFTPTWHHKKQPILFT